jgi:cobalt-precorrin 5A hydrolase / cobalt-factor III methyltransferase / precorrin-3B C17-methyltransferase
LFPERAKLKITPAIVSFTAAGEDMATRLAQALGAEHYKCGPSGQNAAKLLPALFEKQTPIIGICATGILVRLLASSLQDKREEPPVIAVSQQGKHVVPVLGGHHGANQLARNIARITGGIAAITTASDNRFSRSLDEPPSHFVLANPERAKSAMAALLGGAAIKLEGKADWLEKAGYPLAEDGSVVIRISEKLPDREGLTYHPKTLVAGMGCARGTSADELIALLKQTLGGAGLAPQSLAAIATIDIKSDEPGLHQTAEHFGVPLALFTSKELAKEQNRIPNPSATVRAETGTPSVAEAAAIKSGSLLVAKQKTKNATCAIGRSEHPLTIEGFGMAPGQLHIVGIGPGEESQRTASAIKALTSASDWVGYGLYLDLISDLENGQNQHRFDLGREEKRVRHALELAATGKNVALVCSGDAQIYAMAALVYELVDQSGERALSPAARRVAIESHPGISALQMASARAGALLGHDFCAISLSDLLTPRAQIEKRLHAAAIGDFVVAFYNPRSKKRTQLLDMAKTLFLEHRPPETPVIIASNLGRDGENVRIVELQHFKPEQVDMLSIVLFGASTSGAFRRGDGTIVAYTPRGYASKGAAACEVEK